MNTPRARILQTASRLFHQQGYNSTGINQIISEANVAKASFYQHFKSKDELCVAFLESRHEYWFTQLHSFTDNAQSPTDKVVAAFDFILQMNNKEQFRGCSFLNILSEISKEQTEILAVIQQHKRDLMKFFQSFILDDVNAMHVYLLFESTIIESQLFQSNNIVLQAKTLINRLF